MKRIFFLLILFFSYTCLAQEEIDTEQLKFISFWEGTNPQMTLKELASYCAPILWYSPDEPELDNKGGKEINIPASFTFQGDSKTPVVYYQIREILVEKGVLEKSFMIYDENKDDIIVDLRDIYAFSIDYNHYYRFEVGLGKHDHDTEQAQFKVYVHSTTDNDGIKKYYLYLIQATGKAHALLWYDNIYHIESDNINFELNLPFHILVEEGKHASVTDMNGDGYYTPGYDVNVRINDAWGLRDVIRTGNLFSSKFEGWMAKVRKPEHRVFPPLPEDSPHREKYMIDGEYARNNSIYELRPMPSPNESDDEILAKDMSGYYEDNWPKIKYLNTVGKFIDWWEAENFINSFGIAFRMNKVAGFSVTFPLLILKNVEAPLVGGWLVNRIYLQDDRLRDFGWGVLYTPSASRFMDGYFSVGLEIDKYFPEGSTELDFKTDFVFETGIKFRGNVKYSPLKFLSVLTEFWGLRVGIKNKGFWNINNLDYVVEIGAGVW